MRRDAAQCGLSDASTVWVYSLQHSAELKRKVRFIKVMEIPKPAAF